MSTDLDRQKASLRGTLREQLNALPPAAFVTASEAIRHRLLVHALWRSSRSMLLFAALAREVDLVPLLAGGIAQGRTMALPRYVEQTGLYEAAEVRDPEEDLTPGHFGIREPRPRCPVLPLNTLDLILVPGLGFDLKGRRLGRGKGYYDRLLAPVRGVRCGIALDDQVVAAIPTGPRDELLDCILTPTRWFACTPRAGLK